MSAKMLMSLILLAVADSHVPVVIWHGMGDNCCHDFSMGYIKQLLEQHMPGVYVRSLMVRYAFVAVWRKMWYECCTKTIKFKICFRSEPALAMTQ